MKKYFLLLLLFSLLTKAQEFKTPNAYFNYIGIEKEIVSKSFWNYNKVLAFGKNQEEADNAKKILLDNIHQSYAKISQLKSGYKGDLDYRNSFLTYLKNSQKQISINSSKIYNDKNIVFQSFGEIENHIKDREWIKNQVRFEAEKLNDSQVFFALKYGLKFEIGDNELSKKMKTAVEVFDNHSELYVILQKATIAENKLIMAFNSKNVEEIVLKTNDLEKYTNEGLEKLQVFKPFSNDNSLANATKEILEFEKEIALDFAPFVISYINENLKFIEAKKRIEALVIANQTPDVVNAFNEMVTKRNNLTISYNLETEKNNTKRLNFLNNWNKTADTFIAKYVPSN